MDARHRITRPMIPDREILLKHLSYDSESGLLRWNHRPQSEFETIGVWKAWHTKFAGKIAGHKSYDIRTGKRHCIRIHVAESNHSRSYVAHRLIWHMLGREVPDGFVIDHKDGDPFNNRIDNLRLARPHQNSSNKTVSVDIRKHKLPKGVIPSNNKHGKPFRATVKTNGKVIYAGVYCTIEEAVAARNAAAKLYHGDFHKPTPCPQLP